MVVFEAVEDFRCTVFVGPVGSGGLFEDAFSAERMSKDYRLDFVEPIEVGIA